MLFSFEAQRKCHNETEIIVTTATGSFLKDDQSINRSVYIYSSIYHPCIHSYVHPSICVYHHCPYILQRPRHFSPVVLQDSVEGGKEGSAGVCIKPPSHLSALIAPLFPSLRCRGEEGSNYSGVSVAGCDSSPGKGRRASITHRPATG